MSNSIYCAEPRCNNIDMGKASRKCREHTPTGDDQ